MKKIKMTAFYFISRCATGFDKIDPISLKPRQHSMLIESPISLGELVDKITILEIKAKNISDQEKIKNVANELKILGSRLGTFLDKREMEKLEPLKTELSQINKLLWSIEDDIREHEKDKNFGESFIKLARAVYVTNDRRARIKKEINMEFGSDLIEEKSYQEYS